MRTQESKIVSIEPVGPKGVWDIEVEEDHSYVAGGLIHHNSSEPNLTNISKERKVQLRDRTITIVLKKVFRFTEEEAKDRQFITSDWDQLEMRLLAEESGDEAMIQAFRDKVDFHTATAIILFGVRPEDKDPKSWKEYRSKAKTVNFAVAYGIGVKTLAANLNISEDEARDFQSEYFIKFPGMKRFIETCMAFVERHGYVETRLGFRRPLSKRDAYKAPNTRIQGTGAQMNKIALTRVGKRLKTEGLRSRLVNDVHDDLIVEHWKDELSVPRIMKEEMERWPMFKVPILADPEICWPSWADKRALTAEEKVLYGL